MQPMTFDQVMDVVDDLVTKGVLGKENCPIHDGDGSSIWSWDVLQEDEIPDFLKPYVQEGVLFL